MPALFETGRMDKVAYEFISGSDEVVPLRLSGQILNDGDGHLVGVVAVLDPIARGCDFVDALGLKPTACHPASKAPTPVEGPGR